MTQVTERRDHRCDRCGMEFSNREQLQQHEQQQHNPGGQPGQPDR